MKKHPILKYLLPIAIVLVVIGVLLYLLHPLAPLLLVLSVLIQAPLVWHYFRVSYAKGFQQREQERKQQYEEDGNAAAWLALEEADAASVGYKYWARAYRDENALNRACLLVKLGRGQEAQALLDGLEPAKLTRTNRNRYGGIAAELREAGTGAETATENAPSGEAGA